MGTATLVQTLTPSARPMELGLHIPPVRATCERPRMVAMVAQDLLEIQETGRRRQLLPQTLCPIGECLRLWGTQRGERLCHHLLETSTSDPLRQNRLNKKTRYFLQLPRQPHTGLRLLLLRGSQLSQHSDNLEGGLSLQVKDNQSNPDNQIPDSQSNPDNQIPDSQSNPDN